MNKHEISRYFSVLARFFPESARIILTGAAAGSVYGGIRATLDVDFALKLRPRSVSAKEKLWEEFKKATEEARILTGISAQYAEDIDRWSSITYLDYEKHTRAFKSFGRLQVRLLDPEYWAIGKCARFLASDERDLIRVLKKTRTPWQRLTQVLGLALRKSPKSTACFQFRRQAENFLRSHGRRIWGRGFSAEKAILKFHQAAKIRRD